MGIAAAGAIPSMGLLHCLPRLLCMTGVAAPDGHPAPYSIPASEEVATTAQDRPRLTYNSWALTARPAGLKAAAAAGATRSQELRS